MVITNVGFQIGSNQSLVVYVFATRVYRKALERRIREFSRTIGMFWRMEEYVQSINPPMNPLLATTSRNNAEVDRAMKQPLRHAWTACRTLAGGEQAIEEGWVLANDLGR